MYTKIAQRRWPRETGNCNKYIFATITCGKKQSRQEIVWNLLQSKSPFFLFFSTSYRFVVDRKNVKSTSKKYIEPTRNISQCQLESLVFFFSKNVERKRHYISNELAVVFVRVLSSMFRVFVSSLVANYANSNIPITIYNNNCKMIENVN